MLEELELDQCDYLNQPGCKKQVEELVREYQDIFTDEGKKVGMVLSRYCTTIKLKPGAVPVKQKLSEVKMSWYSLTNSSTCFLRPGWFR